MPIEICALCKCWKPTHRLPSGDVMKMCESWPELVWLHVLDPIKPEDPACAKFVRKETDND